MIIVVSGLPGSGKSYFAERLSAQLNALYINSDRIRKEVNAMGHYTLDDKLAVYKEMNTRTEEALQKHKMVILDATFYLQNMRNLFKNTARTYLTDICFIHVWAKETLIKKRIEQPRIDSEADFKVYEKIKEEYEEIREHHLKLESTNENIDEMIMQASDYVHTCHGRK